jgi:Tfp pilus assembly protein FimT
MPPAFLARPNFRNLWASMRIDNDNDMVQESSVKLTLTAAQIKAIRATPITILPALDSGFVYELVGGIAHFKYPGTNVFTNPQNLSLRYKDATGVVISQAITATGFLDQATSMQTSILALVNAIATKTQANGQAVVIHNVGASEITGNAGADNTIDIMIRYRVWRTTF